MAGARLSKLNTWKEIARYLGRDERTAKRWEATRGLPVRRVPGAGRSTVYAYGDALDAWLAGAEPPASPEPAAGLDVPPPATEPMRASRGSWALVAGVGAAVALIGVASVASKFHGGIASADAWATTAKQAPELYMKGLYAWHTRSRSGLADAIADFSKVLLRDPDYAPAWVGLADCYDLMPEFGGMNPAQAYPQAKVAAERAIALDDRLAGAHRALAFVDFWWSHDVAGSQREFERSLHLDPKAALTHHWYANTLAMTGDFARAIAEINEAERLDPATTAIRADKAVVLFDSGRVAEAVDTLKAVISAEPDFAPAHSYLATIYVSRGDTTAGLAEIAATARLSGDAGAVAIANDAEQGYRQAGRAGMDRAALKDREAQFRAGVGSAYVLAADYAPIDPDRSFALLRQALDRGDPLIMSMRVDPRLRPLHGDPRFAVLLTAVHLPPLLANG